MVYRDLLYIGKQGVAYSLPCFDAIFVTCFWLEV